MRVTIDKAGRIVVPKQIRNQYHMYPGVVLEIESEADGILLRVENGSPSLIKKEGVLIHHGETKSSIDSAEFINSERENRNFTLQKRLR